jgi:hypothetical protein
MAKRLLERQVSLLHYLTSGGAIFDDQRAASFDAALDGIDRELLNLEARFSYEKRLEKIAAVFPRTFALLGVNRETLIRQFVDAFPPLDIDRLVNARQFHDFLCARWRNDPAYPAFLPDVAACELAIAAVRAAAEDNAPESIRPKGRTSARIRRRRAVVLRRCAYDIQPIFEDDAASVPVERETLLAIVAPPDSSQPGIFELDAAVFDLLTALDDWTDLAGLGGLPEADELVISLTEAGLIEVSR